MISSNIFQAQLLCSQLLLFSNMVTKIYFHCYFQHFGIIMQLWRWKIYKHDSLPPLYQWIFAALPRRMHKMWCNVVSRLDVILLYNWNEEKHIVDKWWHLCLHDTDFITAIYFAISTVNAKHIFSIWSHSIILIESHLYNLLQTFPLYVEPEWFRIATVQVW